MTMHCSLDERAGHEEAVIPVTSDEFEVDATPCKTVQRPVFRAAIDTPEPRAAEVCEPGAELKPQQSERYCQVNRFGA